MYQNAPTATAKSLQSCPTLCDPVDGSPPGSPVPGILQTRTLEWGAISFSSAWKWKVKVKSLSHVQPSGTAWTAAHQASPSMGVSRQEYWSGMPLPSPKHSKPPFIIWIGNISSLCVLQILLRMSFPSGLVFHCCSDQWLQIWWLNTNYCLSFWRSLKWFRRAVLHWHTLRVLLQNGPFFFQPFAKRVSFSSPHILDMSLLPEGWKD